MENSSYISDTEDVARLLHPSWVVDGVLQHYAFVLRRNETYISVNRPAVSFYTADVTSFVENHPTFYVDKSQTEYMRALLRVGDVRLSKVTIDDIVLNIDVEVEPRDAFTKSHAGIFTRYEGQNLKVGDTVSIESSENEVSTDDVLLEVRSHLLDLARMEICKLPPKSTT